MDSNLQRSPSPLGTFSKYTAAPAPQDTNINQRAVGNNLLAVTTTNGNTKSFILEGGGSNQSSHRYTHAQQNQGEQQNELNQMTSGGESQQRHSMGQPAQRTSALGMSNPTNAPNIMSSTGQKAHSSVQNLPSLPQTQNHLTINIHKNNSNKAHIPDSSQESDPFAIKGPETMPPTRPTNMSQQNQYSQMGHKNIQPQPSASIGAQKLLANPLNPRNCSTKRIPNANNHGDASSVGASKSYSAQGHAAKGGATAKSQGSSSRRYYHYCIDTSQIISMLEYAIKMLSLSQYQINSKRKDNEVLQGSDTTNRDLSVNTPNNQQRSKSNHGQPSEGL